MKAVTVVAALCLLCVHAQDDCRSETVSCVGFDALWATADESTASGLWAGHGTSTSIQLGDDKNDNAVGFLMACDNVATAVGSGEVMEGATFVFHVGVVVNSPLESEWPAPVDSATNIRVDLSADFGSSTKFSRDDVEAAADFDDAVEAWAVDGDTVRMTFSADAAAALGSGSTRLRGRMDPWTDLSNENKIRMFGAGVTDAGVRARVEVTICPEVVVLPAVDADGDGACNDAAAEQSDEADGVCAGVDLCPNTPLRAATDASFPGCTTDQLDALDVDRDGYCDHAGVAAPGVCSGFDQCPSDAAKFAPGQCGCDNVDTDVDGDGVSDCVDACPGADDGVDTDSDGAPDGCDTCPGSPDGADADLDGTPDGCDACPADPRKVAAGACGCGFLDTTGCVQPCYQFTDCQSTASCPSACTTSDGVLPPTSGFVRRTGRVLVAGDALEFDHAGVSLRLKFSGSTRLWADIDEESRNIYAIQVNGDTDDAPQVTTSSGRRTYTLLEGLDASATYDVTVYKVSEVSSSSSVLAAKVTLFGFHTDAGATLHALEARLPRRIEFLGDSITAGWGNLCTNKNGNVFTDSSNWWAYGTRLAVLLEAEAHQVAWSGRGLYQNRNGQKQSSGETMDAVYRRTVATEDADDWDFSSWVPSVVVVNLGENDYHASSSSPTDAQWEAAVHGLVSDIDGVYGEGEAAIVFTCGPMSDDMCAPTQAALASLDRQDVHYYDFNALGLTLTGCNSAFPHPHREAAQAMANAVADLVEDAAGWGVDTDGDGVSDRNDDCSGTPAASNVNTIGCRQVDVDADGDQVCDDATLAIGLFCSGQDNCPGLDNGDQVDTDGDGQGDACDADDDGDGVEDTSDVCPDTPLGATPSGAVSGCSADQVAALDGDGDGKCDTAAAAAGAPAEVCQGVDPCPLDAADDSDGDGVCDSDDVCPGSNDGVDTDADGAPDGCDPCPLGGDEDADGVCDVADRCPGTPAGAAFDGSSPPGCTLVQLEALDADQDGVCNTAAAAADAALSAVPVCAGVDACPTDAAKVVTGLCGCGVPDDDSDFDGLADCVDPCPSDPDVECADEDDVVLMTCSGEGGETGSLQGFNGVGLRSDGVTRGEAALRIGAGLGFIVSCVPPADGRLAASAGRRVDAAFLQLQPGATSGGPYSLPVGEDPSVTVDVAQTFGSMLLLEPSDFHAAADATDLAAVVTETDDAQVRLSLQTDKVGALDRTADRWQFRVLAVEEAADGWVAFHDAAAPGGNTAPTLRILLQPDGCPEDDDKLAPGLCGCGVPDTDSDADGTLDCNDECPSDAAKTVAGVCGCGLTEADSDGDGTLDCNDGCPDDASKTAPTPCACGVAETDTNKNGIADCVEQSSEHRAIVLADFGIRDVNDEKDKDDLQSLVRLLLYANEVEIEGIVSTQAWRGTLDDRTAGIFTTPTFDAIDAYDSVYDTLRQHDSRYPEASVLRARVKAGKLTSVNPQNFMTGDYAAFIGASHDTAASNHIIDVVDKEDDRPVWLLGWGKMLDAAQALYRVRASRTTAQLNTFVSKLRVYDIAGQDNCGAWIAYNFPTIKYLRSLYAFQGLSYLSGDLSLFGSTWYNANVFGKGPLAGLYPSLTTSHSVVEGDTPSLLHLVANGLSDPEEQTWGNWGGRFESTKATNPSRSNRPDSAFRNFFMYKEAKDSSSVYIPISRWRQEFQNELAARLDWTIKSFAAANHAPVAAIDGELSRDAVRRTASGGSKVTLDASASTDPDNDSLSYSWFHYEEPSTASGSASISGSSSAVATVTLPTGSGKTVHIILTVTDNGSPALSAYRRVVFTLS